MSRRTKMLLSRSSSSLAASVVFKSEPGESGSYSLRKSLAPIRASQYRTSLQLVLWLLLIFQNLSFLVTGVGSGS